jgi:hypothetical protein
MQCTRCYTYMQLAKRENHQHSSLEWHQCPLCKRMEFIAEPIRYETDPVESLISTPVNLRAAYS